MEPSDRASQPKGVREAVLEANGEGCTYCSWENAEALDHLVPHDEGGRDDITNLVPACRSCNSSKRNRTVAQWKRAIQARPTWDVWTSHTVPREYHDPDRVVNMQLSALESRIARIQLEIVSGFQERHEAAEAERILGAFNTLFNRMGSLSPSGRALLRSEMQQRLAGQEDLLEAEPLSRRLALITADWRQHSLRRQLKTQPTSARSGDASTTSRT